MNFGLLAAMALSMEVGADDLELPTTAAMLRHLVVFVAMLIGVVVTLGAIPIIALALAT